MKRVRRRLWFRFTDHESNKWRVWLTTDILPAQEPGKDCRGYTMPDERIIWISLRHPNLQRLYETTWHELFHSSLGRTEPGLEMDAEEYFAYHSERGLAAIAKSLGFRFKALPKGVDLATDVPPAGR